MLSTGDAFHPAESLDPALQVAIISENTSRWYGSHLMIFLGLLAFFPGMIAVSELVSEKRPALGYFARNLMLIGAGAFSAIFVFEMLIGRYVAEGATGENATELLETFASPWMLGILLPIGVIALFGGVWLMTLTFIVSEPQYRWPASLLGIGVLLILVEILSARVIFSQAGNIALLIGGIGFAIKILRRSRSSPAT